MFGKQAEKVRYVRVRTNPRHYVGCTSPATPTTRGNIHIPSQVVHDPSINPFRALTFACPKVTSRPEKSPETILGSPPRRISCIRTSQVLILGFTLMATCVSILQLGHLQYEVFHSVRRPSVRMSGGSQEPNAGVTLHTG